LKKSLKIALFSLFSLTFFYSINNVLAQQETTDTTNKVWDIAYLALAVSTILGIFVVVLLLYFMNKYKEGAPTKRRIMSHSAERNLEIVWIVLSVILVAFATGATLVYTGEVEATQTDVGVDEVFVIEGQQFQWEFFNTLPDKSRNASLGAGNLELEVNKKYELIITARDVIHSFFIYDLGIKQDAVPGHEVSIFLEPAITGSFEIRCAQYCGSSHYQMAGIQNIIVV
jgi:cytochrome c oxidase subunit 2